MFLPPPRGRPAAGSSRHTQRRLTDRVSDCMTVSVSDYLIDRISECLSDRIPEGSLPTAGRTAQQSWAVSSEWSSLRKPVAPRHRAGASPRGLAMGAITGSPWRHHRPTVGVPAGIAAVGVSPRSPARHACSRLNCGALEGRKSASSPLVTRHADDARHPTGESAASGHPKSPWRPSNATFSGGARPRSG